MFDHYMKRFVFALVTVLTVSTSHLFSFEGKYPFELNVSYTTANGIGYDSGYTTLGLLAMPSLCTPICLQPFLDVRGHWFDKGRSAVNAGVGVRYITPNANNILGGNIYYDYRSTSWKEYHQVGVGVELLRCNWEVRANGYFPVSGERSHFRPGIFNQYQGGYYFSLQPFNNTFWGVDLELGGSLNYLPILKEYFNLYAAIGPYYYKSAYDREDFKGKIHAVGGRFRLELDLTKYISLECRVTADRIFKTNVQGVFNLEIPLSNLRNFFESSAKGNDCCSSDWKCDKITQPVFRSEIIPIKRHCLRRCNFDCSP